jgi:hypothetical protein
MTTLIKFALKTVLLAIIFTISILIASSDTKAGYNDKPKNWCGWQVRQTKGGGPEMNPANSWCSWGRASEPQIGAVVVKHSHAGIIVGKSAAGWLVRAGNERNGTSVVTRVWDLRGACIRGSK